MYSALVAKEETYSLVYNSMRDSLKVWGNAQLNKYRFINGLTWELDSLICFNRKVDKCLTTIHIQSGSLDKSDASLKLYGVCINKKWYFFTGPTLIFIRDQYQKNGETGPLSFERMKELAMEHIYRRYLIKNSNGEWEINDAFFGDFTSVAWGRCTTQAEWDSVYLSIVRDNWKK
jgi:hypothetical protein